MASPFRILTCKMNSSRLLCSVLSKHCISTSISKNCNRTFSIAIQPKLSERKSSILPAKCLLPLKTYGLSNECLLRLNSSLTEMHTLDPPKGKQWDEDIVVYLNEDSKDLVYLNIGGVLVACALFTLVWKYFLEITPERIKSQGEHKAIEGSKLWIVNRKEKVAAGIVFLVIIMQTYQLRYFLYLVRRISLLADGQTVRVSTNTVMGNVNHYDHHVDNVYLPHPKQLAEGVNKRMFVLDQRFAYLIEAKADLIKTSLLKDLGAVKPGIPERTPGRVPRDLDS